MSNQNLKGAVMAKNIEKVRELLQQGADPNKEDHWNRTPLFVVWNNVEIARLLLEAGADVNHVDKDGETPLWKAVRNGFPELVKLYLENGADPNHLLRNGLSLLEFSQLQINKELSLNETEKSKTIYNLLDKAMRPKLERSVAEVLSAPRNPQGWMNMLSYKSYPSSMSNVTREQRRNKGIVRTLKSKLEGKELTMNNILRAQKKSFENLKRGKYANRGVNEAAGIPEEIGVKISNFLTPRKKINILKEKWEKEKKNKNKSAEGGRRKTRKSKN